MIWYAAYGSNLLSDRFACYIHGGKAPGAAWKEHGARDQSPPQDERAVFLPYRLYCAGRSRRWAGGGVAFLDDERDEDRQCLARMYLIEEQQFEDVVRQENGDPDLHVDFEALLERGSLDCGGGWYARLLLLGEQDGLPILTCTSPRPFAEQQINAPSPDYLRCIAAGLRQTYALNKQGLRRYLKTVPGIAGAYTGAQLNTLWEEAEGMIAPA